MFSFALRNLRIFFRQKSTVFFSLLGVFIIIGLYVLFLGDVWKTNFADIPEIDVLLNNWIIAGIVSVTGITSTMGAFGIMIEDKTQGVIKDFYSSPIKRSTIVGGYVLSAYVIGVILSVVALALGQLYILFGGGDFMSLGSIVKMLGVLLVSTMASSSLIFFIVTLFSSNSAFSTASTVIGTLIGFLTGIYLPIGSLPEAVQWVVKLFPVSHAGALMRQIMMSAPMDTSFAGVPQEYITGFSEMMGVTYKYGDYVATTATHLLVLLGCSVIFFGLAVWNVKRSAK